MPKVSLPKWKSARRAFLVYILRKFSNFHKLEECVVISDKMPLPEDIGLKENEEILRITEMNAKVVVK